MPAIVEFVAPHQTANEVGFSICFLSVLIRVKLIYSHTWSMIVRSTVHQHRSNYRCGHDNIQFLRRCSPPAIHLSPSFTANSGARWGGRANNTTSSTLLALCHFIACRIRCLTCRKCTNNHRRWCRKWMHGLGVEKGTSAKERYNWAVLKFEEWMSKWNEHLFSELGNNYLVKI